MDSVVGGDRLADQSSKRKGGADGLVGLAGAGGIDPSQPDEDVGLRLRPDPSGADEQPERCSDQELVGGGKGRGHDRAAAAPWEAEA